MERCLVHSQGRSAAVDTVKLAAAGAVVWLHVAACAESQQYFVLCRFAVPFFTATAVFYVLDKAVQPDGAALGAFCIQRVRRLYVPFLVWAALYLVMRVSKHALFGQGSSIVLSPAVFLNGTTHHLWFLPFICLVSILAFGSGKLLERFREDASSARLILMLTILGVAAAFAPGLQVRTAEAPITYFISHTLHTVPSVFLGAAVFYLLRGGKLPVWSRILTLFSVVLSIASEVFAGPNVVAPHLASAGLLFFAATQPNYSWLTPISKWARLAFAIYLIHVFFVEVLDELEKHFGNSRSVSADLSIWALAVVASALTAQFFSRLRMLRWAFPH